MKRLEEIFNVAEKCVVVTGACGYFGSYIVKTLLELNAKVILLSHSDELHNVLAEYTTIYGIEKVVGYKIDFYDRDQSIRVLKNIILLHEIDAVINNAYDMSAKTGFDSKEDGCLEKIEYTKLEHSLQSGVFWAFRTTQIIGEQFIKKEVGSIINISSMYSEISPNPALYEGKEFFNPPGYSISKAALDALTRYTASFWGKYGIRCNSILPGPFPKKIDVEFLKRLQERTVLNRVGHLRDLIGFIIYLVSDASKFMTGQSIKIDGGWTIT